ncbi:nucleoside phosphorylase domain-containing protein [Lactarius hengduanensis]|nr:nucleoside phosphorylase domain-containing protein [Lactarius hengduanensis]
MACKPRYDGLLCKEMLPGTFVLLMQIIDCTCGMRPASFFDASIVAHTVFGDPFTNALVGWLAGPVRCALQDEGHGVELVTDTCIMCMEGLQFSTHAESIMYCQWGGDLINMSVLPEAKLVCEVEISYALIATVTDYDSWWPNSEVVTTADVTIRYRAINGFMFHVSYLFYFCFWVSASDSLLFLEFLPAHWSCYI